jgi:hypothetical protein
LRLRRLAGEKAKGEAESGNGAEHLAFLSSNAASMPKPEASSKCDPPMLAIGPAHGQPRARA